MAKNRPGPPFDRSRTEREEAAARRLAMLAADLGHGAPDSVATASELQVSPTHWPGAPQPAAPETPEQPPEAPQPDDASDDAAPVPTPGRHADRRRTSLPSLPGIGPAHLAVLAVLVAVALAGTTWWLLRDRPTQVAESTADPAAAPLVAVSSAGTDPDDETAATAPGDASSTGNVTVDVAGKVRRPGIVVLDEGARVVDALDAAGGPRKGVQTQGINLARVLADGEQIVVGRPAPTRPTLAPSGAEPLVDLNRADPAELEELPGVGPVTAAAIVEWREQHGGFRSVDQLIDVSGVGEKTLAEIAPHATV